MEEIDFTRKEPFELKVYDPKTYVVNKDLPGVIYMALNKITGMMYIGYSIDVIRRIRDHYKTSRHKKYYFYQHFNSRTKNNWIWYILKKDLTSNRSQLSIYEKYYIDLFKSYEYGCNSTKGGSDNCREGKIFYITDGVIDFNGTVREISNKLNVSNCHARNIFYKNKHIHGWVSIENKDIRESIIKSSKENMSVSKPYVKYSLFRPDVGIIEGFSKDLQEKYGVLVQSLRKTHSSKGFVLSEYQNIYEEKISICKKKTINRNLAKSIYNFLIDSRFILEYGNVRYFCNKGISLRTIRKSGKSKGYRFATEQEIFQYGTPEQIEEYKLKNQQNENRLSI